MSPRHIRNRIAMPLATGILLFAVPGCGTTSTRSSKDAQTQTSSPSSAAIAVPDSSARVPVDTNERIKERAAPSGTAIARLPDSGRGTSSGMIKPIPGVARSKPLRVTVHDVRTTPELVGRTVTVSGRCIGDSSALALGAPPMTRSDWQLASAKEAVYVSGEKPAPCRTGEADVTINARVVQDTVHGLGRAVARQYLVRLADEHP